MASETIAQMQKQIAQHQKEFEKMEEFQELDKNLYTQLETRFKEFEQSVSQLDANEITEEEWTKNHEPLLSDIASDLAHFSALIKQNSRKEAVSRLQADTLYLQHKANIDNLPEEHRYQDIGNALRDCTKQLETSINQYIIAGNYTWEMFEENFQEKMESITRAISSEQLFQETNTKLLQLIEKIKTFLLVHDLAAPLRHEVSTKLAELEALQAEYYYIPVKFVDFTTLVNKETESAAQWLNNHISTQNPVTFAALQEKMARFPESDNSLFFYTLLRNFITELGDDPAHWDYGIAIDFNKCFQDYDSYAQKAAEFDNNELFLAEAFAKNLEKKIIPSFLQNLLVEAQEYLGTLIEQCLNQTMPIETFLPEFTAEQTKFLEAKEKTTQLLKNKEEYDQIVMEKTKLLHDKENLHPRLTSRFNATIAKLRLALDSYTSGDENQIDYDTFCNRFSKNVQKYNETAIEFRAFNDRYTKYTNARDCVRNLPNQNDSKNANLDLQLLEHIVALQEINVLYGVNVPGGHVFPVPECFKINTIDEYLNQFNARLSLLNNDLTTRQQEIAERLKPLEASIGKLIEHVVKFSPEYIDAIKQAEEIIAKLLKNINDYKTLSIPYGTFKENITNITNSVKEGPLNTHRGWKEINQNAALFFGTLGVGYALAAFFTGHLKPLHPNTYTVDTVETMGQNLNRVKL